MQLEYIDLNSQAVKVNIISEKGEIIRKAHFDYSPLTFTFEKIGQDIKLFVEENHFILEPKLNVIVTSRSTYTTTIVLPRTSKTKIFLDNEIQDQFGLDYKDKFSLYSSTGKYRKDGTVTYVCLIPNTLVNSFNGLAKVLGMKLEQVTTINLLLAEKEQYSSLITSKKTPHCSLYIRNFYSVINIVVNGEIVSSYISECGYKELTKENVVKRMNTIQLLNSYVLSLCGENELYYKNTPVQDFYLYCKDEVLRNQFVTKKLNIPYYFIEDEDFQVGLFKKYVFNIRKILLKLQRGMTLVEVVVSMAIFAIVTSAMIGLIYATYDMNKEDDSNILRANAISNLYERFKVNPNSYLDGYFKDYGITGGFTQDNTTEQTFYFNAKYEPTLTDEIYEAKLSKLDETRFNDTQVKYSQSILKITEITTAKIVDDVHLFETIL